MVTTRHLIQSKKYFGHEFDPVCVKYLNEILEITDSKIVVISSWREGRTLKQIQSIFEINGIIKVVGITPLIKDVIRGKEIMEYIFNTNKTDLEVHEFVIIDDEEEMGELTGHLIRTEFAIGIDEFVKNEVIRRLG